ncbi:MAG: hypothetical protein JO314_00565, partial [Acidobacteria bacterium]|nr:hypothetical protein [Acidobacteriota bacterium]
MERDANAYIFDVVENADKIFEFVAGLDVDLYRANDIVKSAVERRFINIGEALTKLKSSDLVAFGDIPYAARIVAFR